MEPKRRNDACLEKMTKKQEQAASRESVGPKKERLRFGSSEERRPGDASPVSVVFRVDRVQVLGVVAARTTTCATSAAAAAAAAAAAFVMWVPLVASPKKHENRFRTSS